LKFNVIFSNKKKIKLNFMKICQFKVEQFHVQRGGEVDRQILRIRLIN